MAWQLVQTNSEDLAQLSPDLTSHILRFGAYATDGLHVPPDVFDPAGRGRLWRRTAAAAQQGTVTQQRVV
jgi:hypothetical protein